MTQLLTYSLHYGGDECRRSHLTLPASLHYFLQPPRMSGVHAQELAYAISHLHLLSFTQPGQVSSLQSKSKISGSYLESRKGAICRGFFPFKIIKTQFSANLWQTTCCCLSIVVVYFSLWWNPFTMFHSYWSINWSCDPVCTSGEVNCKKKVSPSKLSTIFERFLNLNVWLLF